MLPSWSPVRNRIGTREAGPERGDLRFTAAGMGASPPLTEYSAAQLNDGEHDGSTFKGARQAQQTGLR